MIEIIQKLWGITTETAVLYHCKKGVEVQNLWRSDLIPKTGQTLSSSSSLHTTHSDAVTHSISIALSLSLYLHHMYYLLLLFHSMLILNDNQSISVHHKPVVIDCVIITVIIHTPHYPNNGQLDIFGSKLEGDIKVLFVNLLC